MSFGIRFSRRRKSGALDVTEGVIWKQIIQLGVPVFLANFFQQAYGLANTFILGRYSNFDALGAVQATLPICDLVVGLSVGIGTGSAIICGQYFGAREDENLSRSVSTAMMLAVIVGLVFALIGVLFAPYLLFALNTPDEFMEQALIFIRVYFSSVVFSLIFNTGLAIQRAVGDTRSPAFMTAGTCLINIALDYLFIAVLGLGAEGAAMGTFGALIGGTIMVLVRLSRVKAHWSLNLKKLVFHRTMAREMLRCGLPMGLQSAAYSVSNMIVQININAFGPEIVTAWGISGRVNAIVWMMTESMAVAATTFSAQNVGAGKIKRLHRARFITCVVSCVVIGLSALGLMWSARYIISTITTDAYIQEQCTYMTQFIVPFYVIYALIAIHAGVIRGAGESFKPMLITLIGTCALRIVWLWTVVPHWQTIESILLVYPFTYVVTLIAFLIYYHWEHWLDRAVETFAHKRVKAV